MDSSDIASTGKWSELKFPTDIESDSFKYFIQSSSKVREEFMLSYTSVPFYYIRSDGVRELYSVSSEYNTGVAAFRKGKGEQEIVEDSDESMFYNLFYHYDVVFFKNSLRDKLEKLKMKDRLKFFVHRQTDVNRSDIEVNGKVSYVDCVEETSFGIYYDPMDTGQEGMYDFYFSINIDQLRHNTELHDKVRRVFPIRLFNKKDRNNQEKFFLFECFLYVFEQQLCHFIMMIFNQIDKKGKSEYSAPYGELYKIIYLQKFGMPLGVDRLSKIDLRNYSSLRMSNFALQKYSVSHPTDITKIEECPVYFTELSHVGCIMTLLTMSLNYFVESIKNTDVYNVDYPEQDYHWSNVVDFYDNKYSKESIVDLPITLCDGETKDAMGIINAKTKALLTDIDIKFFNKLTSVIDVIFYTLNSAMKISNKSLGAFFSGGSVAVLFASAKLLIDVEIGDKRFDSEAFKESTEKEPKAPDGDDIGEGGKTPAQDLDSFFRDRDTTTENILYLTGSSGIVSIIGMTQKATFTGLMKDAYSTTRKGLTKITKQKKEIKDREIGKSSFIVTSLSTIFDFFTKSPEAKKNGEAKNYFRDGLRAGAKGIVIAGAGAGLFELVSGHDTVRTIIYQSALTSAPILFKLGVDKYMSDKEKNLNTISLAKARFLRDDRKKTAENFGKAAQHFQKPEVVEEYLNFKKYSDQQSIGKFIGHHNLQQNQALVMKEVGSQQNLDKIMKSQSTLTFNAWDSIKEATMRNTASKSIFRIAMVANLFLILESLQKIVKQIDFVEFMTASSDIPDAKRRLTGIVDAVSDLFISDYPCLKPAPAKCTKEEVDAVIEMRKTLMPLFQKKSKKYGISPEQALTDLKRLLKGDHLEKHIEEINNCIGCLREFFSGEAGKILEELLKSYMGGESEEQRERIRLLLGDTSLDYESSEFRKQANSFVERLHTINKEKESLDSQKKDIDEVRQKLAKLKKAIDDIGDSDPEAKKQLMKLKKEYEEMIAAYERSVSDWEKAKEELVKEIKKKYHIREYLLGNIDNGTPNNLFDYTKNDLFVTGGVRGVNILGDEWNDMIGVIRQFLAAVPSASVKYGQQTVVLDLSITEKNFITQVLSMFRAKCPGGVSVCPIGEQTFSLAGGKIDKDHVDLLKAFIRMQTSPINFLGDAFNSEQKIQALFKAIDKLAKGEALTPEEQQLIDLFNRRLAKILEQGEIDVHVSPDDNSRQSKMLEIFAKVVRGESLSNDDFLVIKDVVRNLICARLAQLRIDAKNPALSDEQRQLIEESITRITMKMHVIFDEDLSIDEMILFLESYLEDHPDDQEVIILLELMGVGDGGIFTGESFGIDVYELATISLLAGTVSGICYCMNLAYEDFKTSHFYKKSENKYVNSINNILRYAAAPITIAGSAIITSAALSGLMNKWHEGEMGYVPMETNIMNVFGTDGIFMDTIHLMNQMDDITEFFYITFFLASSAAISSARSGIVDAVFSPDIERKKDVLRKKDNISTYINEIKNELLRLTKVMRNNPIDNGYFETGLDDMIKTLDYSSQINGTEKIQSTYKIQLNEEYLEQKNTQRIVRHIDRINSLLYKCVKAINYTVYNDTVHVANVYSLFATMFPEFMMTISAKDSRNNSIILQNIPYIHFDQIKVGEKIESIDASINKNFSSVLSTKTIRKAESIRSYPRSIDVTPNKTGYSVEIEDLYPNKLVVFAENKIQKRNSSFYSDFFNEKIKVRSKGGSVTLTCVAIICVDFQEKLGPIAPATTAVTPQSAAAPIGKKQKPSSAWEKAKDAAKIPFSLLMKASSKGMGLVESAGGAVADGISSVAKPTVKFLDDMINDEYKSEIDKIHQRDGKQNFVMYFQSSQGTADGKNDTNFMDWWKYDPFLQSYVKVTKMELGLIFQPHEAKPGLPTTKKITYYPVMYFYANKASIGNIVAHNSFIKKKQTKTLTVSDYGNYIREELTPDSKLLQYLLVTSFINSIESMSIKLSYYSLGLFRQAYLDGNSDAGVLDNKTTQADNEKKQKVQSKKVDEKLMSGYYQTLRNIRSAGAKIDKCRKHFQIKNLDSFIKGPAPLADKPNIKHIKEILNISQIFRCSVITSEAGESMFKSSEVIDEKESLAKYRGGLTFGAFYNKYSPIIYGSFEPSSSDAKTSSFNIESVYKNIDSVENPKGVEKAIRDIVSYDQPKQSKDKDGKEKNNLTLKKTEIITFLNESVEYLRKLYRLIQFTGKTSDVPKFLEIIQEEDMSKIVKQILESVGVNFDRYYMPIKYDTNFYDSSTKYKLDMERHFFRVVKNTVDQKFLDSLKLTNESENAHRAFAANSAAMQYNAIFNTVYVYKNIALRPKLNAYETTSVYDINTTNQGFAKTREHIENLEERLETYMTDYFNILSRVDIGGFHSLMTDHFMFNDEKYRKDPNYSMGFIAPLSTVYNPVQQVHERIPNKTYPEDNTMKYKTTDTTTSPPTVTEHVESVEDIIIKEYNKRPNTDAALISMHLLMYKGAYKSPVVTKGKETRIILYNKLKSAISTSDLIDSFEFTDHEFKKLYVLLMIVQVFSKDDKELMGFLIEKMDDVPFSNITEFFRNINQMRPEKVPKDKSTDPFHTQIYKKIIVRLLEDHNLLYTKFIDKIVRQTSGLAVDEDFLAFVAIRYSQKKVSASVEKPNQFHANVLSSIETLMMATKDDGDQLTTDLRYIFEKSYVEFATLIFGDESELVKNYESGLKKFYAEDTISRESLEFLRTTIYLLTCCSFIYYGFHMVVSQYHYLFYHNPEKNVFYSDGRYKLTADVSDERAKTTAGKFIKNAYNPLIITKDLLDIELLVQKKVKINKKEMETKIDENGNVVVDESKQEEVLAGKYELSPSFYSADNNIVLLFTLNKGLFVRIDIQKVPKNKVVKGKGNRKEQVLVTEMKTIVTDYLINATKSEREMTSIDRNIKKDRWKSSYLVSFFVSGQMSNENEKIEKRLVELNRLMDDHFLFSVTKEDNRNIFPFLIENKQKQQTGRSVTTEGEEKIVRMFQKESKFTYRILQNIQNLNFWAERRKDDISFFKTESYFTSILPHSINKIHVFEWFPVDDTNVIRLFVSRDFTKESNATNEIVFETHVKESLIVNVEPLKLNNEIIDVNYSMSFFDSYDFSSLNRLLFEKYHEIMMYTLDNPSLGMSKTIADDIRSFINQKTVVIDYRKPTADKEGMLLFLVDRNKILHSLQERDELSEGRRELEHEKTINIFYHLMVFISHVEKAFEITILSLLNKVKRSGIIYSLYQDVAGLSMKKSLLYPFDMKTNFSVRLQKEGLVVISNDSVYYSKEMIESLRDYLANKIFIDRFLDPNKISLFYKHTVSDQSFYGLHDSYMKGQRSLAVDKARNFRESSTEKKQEKKSGIGNPITGMKLLADRVFTVDNGEGLEPDPKTKEQTAITGFIRGTNDTELLIPNNVIMAMDYSFLLNIINDAFNLAKEDIFSLETTVSIDNVLTDKERQTEPLLSICDYAINNLFSEELAALFYHSYVQNIFDKRLCVTQKGSTNEGDYAGRSIDEVTKNYVKIFEYHKRMYTEFNNLHSSDIGSKKHTDGQIAKLSIDMQMYNTFKIDCMDVTSVYRNNKSISTNYMESLSEMTNYYIFKVLGAIHDINHIDSKTGNFPFIYLEKNVVPIGNSTAKLLNSTPTKAVYEFNNVKTVLPVICLVNETSEMNHQLNHLLTDGRISTNGSTNGGPDKSFYLYGFVYSSPSISSSDMSTFDLCIYKKGSSNFSDKHNWFIIPSPQKRQKSADEMYEFFEKKAMSTFMDLSKIKIHFLFLKQRSKSMSMTKYAPFIKSFGDNNEIKIETFDEYRTDFVNKIPLNIAKNEHTVDMTYDSAFNCMTHVLMLNKGMNIQPVDNVKMTMNIEYKLEGTKESFSMEDISKYKSIDKNVVLFYFKNAVNSYFSHQFNVNDAFVGSHSNFYSPEENYTMLAKLRISPIGYCYTFAQVSYRPVLYEKMYSIISGRNMYEYSQTCNSTPDYSYIQDFVFLYNLFFVFGAYCELVTSGKAVMKRANEIEILGDFSAAGGKVFSSFSGDNCCHTLAEIYDLFYSDERYREYADNMIVYREVVTKFYNFLLFDKKFMGRMYRLEHIYNYFATSGEESMSSFVMIVNDIFCAIYFLNNFFNFFRRSLANKKELPPSPPSGVSYQVYDVRNSEINVSSIFAMFVFDKFVDFCQPMSRSFPNQLFSVIKNPNSVTYSTMISFMDKHQELTKGMDIGYSHIISTSSSDIKLNYNVKKFLDSLNKVGIVLCDVFNSYLSESKTSYRGSGDDAIQILKQELASQITWNHSFDWKSSVTAIEEATHDVFDIRNFLSNTISPFSRHVLKYYYFGYDEKNTHRAVDVPFINDSIYSKFMRTGEDVSPVETVKNKSFSVILGELFDEIYPLFDKSKASDVKYSMSLEEVAIYMSMETREIVVWLKFQINEKKKEIDRLEKIEGRMGTSKVPVFGAFKQSVSAERDMLASNLKKKDILHEQINRLKRIGGELSSNGTKKMPAAKFMDLLDREGTDAEKIAFLNFLKNKNHVEALSSDHVKDVDDYRGQFGSSSLLVQIFEQFSKNRNKAKQSEYFYIPEQFDRENSLNLAEMIGMKTTNYSMVDVVLSFHNSNMAEGSLVIEQLKKAEELWGNDVKMTPKNKLSKLIDFSFMKALLMSHHLYLFIRELQQQFIIVRNIKLYVNIILFLYVYHCCVVVKFIDTFSTGDYQEKYDILRKSIMGIYKKSDEAFTLVSKDNNSVPIQLDMDAFISFAIPSREEMFRKALDRIERKYNFSTESVKIYTSPHDHPRYSIIKKIPREIAFSHRPSKLYPSWNLAMNLSLTTIRSVLSSVDMDGHNGSTASSEEVSDVLSTFLFPSINSRSIRGKLKEYDNERFDPPSDRPRRVRLIDNALSTRYKDTIGSYFSKAVDMFETELTDDEKDELIEKLPDENADFEEINSMLYHSMSLYSETNSFPGKKVAFFTADNVDKTTKPSKEFYDFLGHTYDYFSVIDRKIISMGDPEYVNITRLLVLRNYLNLLRNLLRGYSGDFKYGRTFTNCLPFIAKIGIDSDLSHTLIEKIEEIFRINSSLDKTEASALMAFVIHTETCINTAISFLGSKEVISTDNISDVVNPTFVNISNGTVSAINKKINDVLVRSVSDKLLQNCQNFVGPESSGNDRKLTSQTALIWKSGSSPITVDTVLSANSPENRLMLLISSAGHSMAIPLFSMNRIDKGGNSHHFRKVTQSSFGEMIDHIRKIVGKQQDNRLFLSFAYHSAINFLKDSTRRNELLQTTNNVRSLLESMAVVDIVEKLWGIPGSDPSVDLFLKGYSSTNDNRNLANLFILLGKGAKSFFPYIHNVGAVNSNIADIRFNHSGSGAPVAKNSANYQFPALLAPSKNVEFFDLFTNRRMLVMLFIMFNGSNGVYGVSQQKNYLQICANVGLSTPKTDQLKTFLAGTGVGGTNENNFDIRDIIFGSTITNVNIFEVFLFIQQFTQSCLLTYKLYQSNYRIVVRDSREQLLNPTINGCFDSSEEQPFDDNPGNPDDFIETQLFENGAILDVIATSKQRKNYSINIGPALASALSAPVAAVKTIELQIIQALNPKKYTDMTNIINALTTKTVPAVLSPPPSSEFLKKIVRDNQVAFATDLQSRATAVSGGTLKKGDIVPDFMKYAKSISSDSVRAISDILSDPGIRSLYLADASGTKITSIVVQTTTLSGGKSPAPIDGYESFIVDSGREETGTQNFNTVTTVNRAAATKAADTDVINIIGAFLSSATGNANIIELFRDVATELANIDAEITANPAKKATKGGVAAATGLNSFMKTRVLLELDGTFLSKMVDLGTASGTFRYKEFFGHKFAKPADLLVTAFTKDLTLGNIAIAQKSAMMFHGESFPALFIEPVDPNSSLAKNVVNHFAGFAGNAFGSATSIPVTAAMSHLKYKFDANDSLDGEDLGGTKAPNKSPLINNFIYYKEGSSADRPFTIDFLDNMPRLIAFLLMSKYISFKKVQSAAGTGSKSDIHIEMDLGCNPAAIGIGITTALAGVTAAPAVAAINVPVDILDDHNNTIAHFVEENILVESLISFCYKTFNVRSRVFRKILEKNTASLMGTRIYPSINGILWLFQKGVVASYATYYDTNNNQPVGVPALFDAFLITHGQNQPVSADLHQFLANLTNPVVIPGIIQVLHSSIMQIINNDGINNSSTTFSDSKKLLKFLMYKYISEYFENSNNVTAIAGFATKIAWAPKGVDLSDYCDDFKRILAYSSFEKCCPISGSVVYKTPDAKRGNPSVTALDVNAITYVDFDIESITDSGNRILYEWRKQIQSTVAKSTSNINPGSEQNITPSTFTADGKNGEGLVTFKGGRRDIDDFFIPSAIDGRLIKETNFAVNNLNAANQSGYSDFYHFAANAGGGVGGGVAANQYTNTAEQFRGILSIKDGNYNGNIKDQIDAANNINSTIHAYFHEYFNFGVNDQASFADRQKEIESLLARTISSSTLLRQLIEKGLKYAPQDTEVLLHDMLDRQPPQSLAAIFGIANPITGAVGVINYIPEMNGFVGNALAAIPATSPTTTVDYNVLVIEKTSPRVSVVPFASAANSIDKPNGAPSSLDQLMNATMNLSHRISNITRRIALANNYLPINLKRSHFSDNRDERTVSFTSRFIFDSEIVAMGNIIKAIGILKSEVVNYNNEQHNGAAGAALAPAQQKSFMAWRTEKRTTAAAAAIPAAAAAARTQINFILGNGASPAVPYITGNQANFITDYNNAAATVAAKMTVVQRWIDQAIPGYAKVVDEFLAKHAATAGSHTRVPFDDLDRMKKETTEEIKKIKEVTIRHPVSGKSEYSKLLDNFQGNKANVGRFIDALYASFIPTYLFVEKDNFLELNEKNYEKPELKDSLSEQRFLYIYNLLSRLFIDQQMLGKFSILDLFVIPDDKNILLPMSLQEVYQTAYLAVDEAKKGKSPRNASASELKDINVSNKEMKALLDAKRHEFFEVDLEGIDPVPMSVADMIYLSTVDIAIIDTMYTISSFVKKTPSSSSSKKSMVYVTYDDDEDLHYSDTKQGKFLMLPRNVVGLTMGKDSGTGNKRYDFADNALSNLLGGSGYEILTETIIEGSESIGPFVDATASATSVSVSGEFCSFISVADFFAMMTAMKNGTHKGSKNLSEFSKNIIDLFFASFFIKEIVANGSSPPLTLNQITESPSLKLVVLQNASAIMCNSTNADFKMDTVSPSLLNSNIFLSIVNTIINKKQHLNGAEMAALNSLLTSIDGYQTTGLFVNYKDFGTSYTQGTSSFYGEIVLRILVEVMCLLIIWFFGDANYVGNLWNSTTGSTVNYQNNNFFDLTNYLSTHIQLNIPNNHFDTGGVVLSSAVYRETASYLLVNNLIQMIDTDRKAVYFVLNGNEYYDSSNMGTSRDNYYQNILEVSSKNSEIYLRITDGILTQKSPQMAIENVSVEITDDNKQEDLIIIQSVHSIQKGTSSKNSSSLLYNFDWGSLLDGKNIGNTSSGGSIANFYVHNYYCEYFTSYIDVLWKRLRYVILSRVTLEKFISFSIKTTGSTSSLSADPDEIVTSSFGRQYNNLVVITNPVLLGLPRETNTLTPAEEAITSLLADDRSFKNEEKEHILSRYCKQSLDYIRGFERSHPKTVRELIGFIDKVGIDGFDPTNANNFLIVDMMMSSLQ